MPVCYKTRAVHVLVSSSSLPEGDPHLGEAARAPVIWPEMTSEAQEVEYVVSKSSSIETKLSEGFGGILAWEDEGAAAAVSEAQATAARAARAQVWEAHASEAKSRTGHPKHVSELRMRSSSLLKRIFSNEEFLVDEEGESKALTRPIWSGKVEYILAQLGYNLKPSNIWWFVSLWLHCGGCESGGQKTRGRGWQAGQRPVRIGNSSGFERCGL